MATLVSKVSHSTTYIPYNRFETLPGELIAMILGYCSDVSTLSSLVQADSFASAIFAIFHKKILFPVLRHQLPGQFAHIAYAIIMFHEGSMLCTAREIIDFYSNESSKKTILSRRLQNPVEDLIHIARVSEDIDTLTRSIGKARVLVPGCYPKEDPSILGPAERYRIQRALWRFQLFYDAAHPINETVVPKNWQRPSRWHRCYVSRSGLSPADWFSPTKSKQHPLIRPLLRNLFRWERQELTAVMYHLRAEVNRIQFESGTEAFSWDNESFLLRRLVRDVNHWTSTKYDHFLVMNPMNTLVNYPDGDGPTAWSDSPEGTNRSNLFGTHMRCLLKWLVQWGGSFWDFERLRQRGHMRLPFPTPARLTLLPRDDDDPGDAGRRVIDLQRRCAPGRTLLPQFIGTVMKLRGARYEMEEREMERNWMEARELTAYIEKEDPRTKARWNMEGFYLDDLSKFGVNKLEEIVLRKWRDARRA